MEKPFRCARYHRCCIAPWLLPSRLTAAADLTPRPASLHGYISKAVAHGLETRRTMLFGQRRPPAAQDVAICSSRLNATDQSATRFIGFAHFETCVSNARRSLHEFAKSIFKRTAPTAQTDTRETYHRKGRARERSAADLQQPCLPLSLFFAIRVSSDIIGE